MAIKKISNIFTSLKSKIRNVRESFGKTEDVDTTPAPRITLPEHEKANRMVIEISLWSAMKVILLVFVAFLAFSFLERITSVLVLLFVSIFFAITLTPGVDRMERWGVPRGLATIFLMILVLSVFFGILGGMIPIIAGEVANMWQGLIDFATTLSQEDFSALPMWMQDILRDVVPIIREYLSGVSPEELQDTITNFARSNFTNYLEKVGDVAGKGLAIVATIFGGIFQTVLVFILTFFLVLEKGDISTFFVQLFPRRYEAYIYEKGLEIKKKISEWVHGQVLIFLIIGVIAYIGLSLIGVKYALTLALIAGLAEFIPYAGPFLAFATAAPVAFNQSLSTGLITMFFYIGIQMVDGNIIIPMVMRKAVGVSPVVTIIAMLIGWEFLGIMGMILAVPVASVVSLFVEDYTPNDRRGRFRKKTE